MKTPLIFNDLACGMSVASTGVLCVRASSLRRIDHDVLLNANGRCGSQATIGKRKLSGLSGVSLRGLPCH